MLNKLSFNLAKELNESETEAIQIKKKVFMEGSDVRVEELKEEKNYVLTEDASSALDSVISGDEVYFRDPDGVAMVVRYSKNYENPEDYDEGYKSEYGGDPEELEAAKQAAEEGNVWEFVEVDDDGTETGTVYNIVYGKEELRKMLEDLREVKMIKKLEDGQIKDAKADSIEKGLYSEGEKICKECGKPLAECSCKKDKVEEAAPVDTSKEDKLASLKTQLEKDGDQLADDEKAAIEDEIANLEKELQEGCDKSLKELDESKKDLDINNKEHKKVQLTFKCDDCGHKENYLYDDLSEKELAELEASDSNTLVGDCPKCNSKYYNMKDYKVIDESNLKEDDRSLARPWSTALINYCENYGVDIWEEELRSLINYLPDDIIGKYIKDTNPNGVSKPEDFYPGEIDESNLKEDYSEKLGGDPEDFVSDVNTIKAALEAIDTESFGTHLAQQMVMDWIETCDYQIEKGNRLASGNEFYNESALNEADGWIAFYNGNKVEITKDEAHDLWSAKQAAIKKLNVPKSKVSLIAVEPAYNESEKIEKKPVVEAAQTEVKDLQVIKEQGNVYMLEDKSEGTRYIVGENYNLSEGEIENAEIYDTKEEADKDYLDRCEVIKDGKEFNTKEDSSESGEDTVTEADESPSSSLEERIVNLKMMDNVARKVNNENLFYNYWLAFGVPDEASEEDYEDLAEDPFYGEMEEVFKKLMKMALEDGLYDATEEELEFARKYEPEIKTVEE